MREVLIARKIRQEDEKTREEVTEAVGDGDDAEGDVTRGSSLGGMCR